MSVIAVRYAKALLDLAIGANAIDEYRDELAMVSHLYESESEFREFLLSPNVSRTVKKSVLARSFENAIGENVLHLLFLLLDKGRIGWLPEIRSSFYAMADEYRNVLNITVTTALPLTEEQIGRIGKRMKAVYRGASVRVSVEMDRSLIGGIRVAVGDKRYDGTVQGKLSAMRSALTGQ